MKRNRRNNAKKERIIMIASSAFVLAALTMTGIYMKSNQVENPDDGYTIDFTALENSAQDKLQEIAQNNQTEDDQRDNITNGMMHNNIDMDESFLSDDLTDEMVNMENDLDYTPMEVGSGQIELPGLPDLSQSETIQDEIKVQDEVELPKGLEAETVLEPETESLPENNEQTETAANNVIIPENLHFAEEDGLIRPVSGEVVIPFNMNKTVHFYTLNNYKCNPALVISADVGTAVAACAEGRVVRIFDNEEIGHAITMDIGNGYEITYGQLEGIQVTLNSYVQAGEEIGQIAQPTKYYCVEGGNLYLELTANGTPVNPEPLFR